MLTEAERVERAERLEWNVGQVRVDDWSIVGGVLGSVSPVFCCVLDRKGGEVGFWCGQLTRVLFWDRM